MVIESKRPWRPLLGLRTPSKRCVKIVGTSKLPMPNDMADARINRSRRVKRLYESTRTPDTATLANRKVVTPPRTGLGTMAERNEYMRGESRERKDGLARKTPDILPRTPKSMRNKQQKRPAVRFAQRVIAITPLFCAKMERGVTVNRAERNPPMPSL